MSLSSLLLCLALTLQPDSSLSPSRVLMAQLKYTWVWTVNLREIFEYVRLKFTVSGQSKQTKNIYIDSYTCMCNTVMLVWDSLRLAPPKIRHHTLAMLVKKMILILSLIYTATSIT